jgi:hypothetical protein
MSKKAIVFPPFQTTQIESIAPDITRDWGGCWETRTVGVPEMDESRGKGIFWKDEEIVTEAIGGDAAFLPLIRDDTLQKVTKKSTLLQNGIWE